MKKTTKTKKGNQIERKKIMDQRREEGRVSLSLSLLSLSLFLSFSQKHHTKAILSTVIMSMRRTEACALSNSSMGGE